jgi:peptidoglycan hydrolase CwlO-like protein
MSELELPRGAQQTLAQMRALDAHVASLKEEFGYDLERVQKALAEARTTYARLRSDVEQRAAQLRSQRKGEEEALAETRALIDALHQDKVAAFDFIGLAFAEALSTIERNQRALDRYLRCARRPGSSAATTSATSATCASRTAAPSATRASSRAWRTSAAM